jgi:hypothetical protein
MYFKIEKGTKTFDKLHAMAVEMIRCNNEALELVKELGFSRFAPDRDSVAGGVGVIGLVGKEKKPDNYKWYNVSSDNYIIPKKNNKEDRAKIDALPKVSKKEYNAVLGFEPQVIEEKGSYTGHYGFKNKVDFFLISMVEGVKFEPNEDMVEIVYSEYEKLSKININQKSK